MHLYHILTVRSGSSLRITLADLAEFFFINSNLNYSLRRALGIKDAGDTIEIRMESRMQSWDVR